MPADAATQFAAAAAGDDYYDYSAPVRERSIWPWLLAVLLVAGAAVAGFYVYHQIQNQLNQAKPVGVPYVVGLKEANAVQSIHDRRARDRSRAHPPPAERHAAEGLRLRPEPEPGRPVGKGSFVEIWVSTGKAQVTVLTSSARTRTTRWPSSPT